tara:strand:+ start:885 stop:1511 length:627 start_codon:yes stop_codon:yes gene_type:complete
MPPYGLYSLANTPEELLQGYGTVRGYDTDPAFGNLKTDIRFQPAPFTGARPFQNMFDLSPAYFEGTNLGFDADLYNPSSGGISGYQIDADDVEMISEKEKKARTGIETLLGFLQNIPTPLNLITGRLEGIRNLNQRLRATDFGRSKTLAEFFDRRARAKEAARRAENFAAFAERTAGTEATGGAGDFSTPAGLDTSYEEASRSFGRDR